MSLVLRIHEPSGEVRHHPIRESLTIGRSLECSITLRDPTVAPEAAEIWPTHDPKSSPSHPSYWFKLSHLATPARLGDIPIREAQIPLEIPLTLGETRITLTHSHSGVASLPTQPTGVRPWLTCSEAGKKLLWMAKKAAVTPLSIYLGGETGTGKEVLAHLIHSWSDRKSGPFIPLHCGALPLSLAESELFGHVKGAFTGAHQHRTGALMQAHRGTLFLDEVGDLPMDIQVKLLRFLENGEIRPVGSDHASKADVRLICATHLPLLKLVEEGKFRRDLYYRLASVPLEIPTLRSRIEDIELLARRFSTDLGKSISPQALMRLKAHHWPGNVRELRHAIERACGITGSFSTLLNEESLEFLITPENVMERPELELGASVLSLEEMERVLLLRALKLAHGNRTKAAKILGVARSTLFEMLKRHKIKGPKMR